MGPLRIGAEFPNLVVTNIASTKHDRFYWEEKNQLETMWKSNFPEILINRVSQLLIFSITFNFYKLNNFNRIVDRLVISFYVQNILICKMQKY